MIRVGFIGAGAIGSLFGGYLASICEKDIEIMLFCSHNQAIAIKNHGLKIKTEDKVLTLQNLNVIDRTSKNINESYDFDYLFLATKAYDTKQAIKQYKGIINNSQYFVILQNGLGNEDLLHPLVPKQKIFRVVTSHGAVLSQPGQLIHTGKGFTFIGIPYLKYVAKDPNLYQEIQSSLDRLNKLLNLAGFESQVKLDILIKVWEKAIVNIGINAIGALTRLSNGKIIENEGLRDLLEISIIEAVDVANHMNIALSKDKCIKLAYSVANQTYNNKNSMLQDILNGKKTEIDYLNGKIVDFAIKLGIQVKANEILTKIIKGLEDMS